MSNWKYTSEKKDVVFRINDDGSMESAFVTNKEIEEWVADGGKISAPDAVVVDPAPTKQELAQQVATLSAQVAALPDDQAT